MKNKDQILLENIYDEIKFGREEEKHITDLTQKISDALGDHDNIEDFAKAVVQALKMNYQTDFIEPFKQKILEYLK